MQGAGCRVSVWILRFRGQDIKFDVIDSLPSLVGFVVNTQWICLNFLRFRGQDIKFDGIDSLPSQMSVSVWFRVEG